MPMTTESRAGLATEFEGDVRKATRFSATHPS